MTIQRIVIVSILCIFSYLLEGKSNCNAPLLTGFLNITDTSFTLRWADFNGDVLGWEIELVNAGENRTLTPSFPLINDNTYTINGLSPGSEYNLFIRTICSENESSSWNGPFIIRTAILPISSCGLNLSIADNNCPREEEFLLLVEQESNLLLGNDLFIQSVELVIEHDWPADLTLRLESPSGNTILLAANQGIGADNYGDPRDTSCKNKVYFSDFACESIRNASRDQIVGTFIPEEPISSLYNNSSVNGLWALSVCDRALDDIGILHAFNINFSPLECTIPTEIAATNINANSVDINWIPPLDCDVVIINVVPKGQAPGTGLEIFTACGEGKFRVDNLEAETEYDIYIASDCTLGQSAFSCPASFMTACQNVTLQEPFDFLTDCENSCLITCDLNSDLFQNSSDDDGDWVISSGPTPTLQTGPIEDISGFGKYLYTENSEDLCGNELRFSLVTNCLYLPAEETLCDMSFFYHMNGDDIGHLFVEISIDDGASWIELFRRSGDQGLEWNRAFINLSTFRDLFFKVRIIAEGNTGDRSDIAIDQIEFYGTRIPSRLPLYFFDGDNDGFGSDSTISLCINNSPDRFADNNLDCNDNSAEINPLKEEIRCNGIDDNCNGINDDSPLTNPILVDNIIVVDEKCPNTKDGSISLSISGGKPPYQVLWNNGKSGNIISGLTDSIYFADIIDADGCIITTEFIDIDTENELTLFTNNVIPTPCLKSEGLIDIAITGGTPPYRYQWSDGSISQDLVNAGEGFYNVTITDQNSCKIISRQYEIIASPRFTAGINFQKNIKCVGDTDGILSIGVIDAIPPIKYRWNTGDTTSLIDNLSSGKYEVTISDNRGCNEILYIDIPEPDTLESEILGIENISCFGEENGKLEVKTRGGVAPFDFTWKGYNNEDPINNKIEDVIGLKAGSYYLLVRDANGCSASSDTIILENPLPISIQVENIINVPCKFSNTGAIEVAASGGSGKYEYFWNTGENDELIDNLTAGRYSIRVIDELGCKASNNNLEIGINNIPLEIEMTILAINNCSADTLGIIATQVDQTARLPIDYNWSSGVQYIKNQKSDTIFQLPSGKYSLTITDAEGCIGTSSEINIPVVEDFFLEEIINTNPSCNSVNDGSLVIETFGGNSPLNFNWSNGSNESILSNVSAGNYSVTITDALGCALVVEDILLTAENPIIIDALVEDKSDANASISLTVTGGSGNYTYSWSDADVNSPIRNNLNLGEYCVTVTDMLNCFESTCFIIDGTDAFQERNRLKFKLFPNPAKEWIQIQTAGTMDKIQVFNTLGKVIYESESNKEIELIDMNEHLPGIYFIKFWIDNNTATAKFLKL